MQTFLPYPDIYKSLSCLDRLRLGKQRLEALEILKIVKFGKVSRWKNHPAVLMWCGHGNLLVKYYNASIDIWISRGYKNSMPYIIPITHDTILEFPWWWGKEEFHASHRSNLLRKNIEWYGQYKWTEPPNIPYWWPSKVEKVGTEL